MIMVGLWYQVLCSKNENGSGRLARAGIFHPRFGLLLLLLLLFIWEKGHWVRSHLLRCACDNQTLLDFSSLRRRRCRQQTTVDLSEAWALSSRWLMITMGLIIFQTTSWAPPTSYLSPDSRKGKKETKQDDSRYTKLRSGNSRKEEEGWANTDFSFWLCTQSYNFGSTRKNSRNFASCNNDLV